MRAALFVVAGLVPVLLSTTASLAEAQESEAGYALRFDGTTDFVRLNATTSMLGAAWPTTKTVSLWVNPTGVPACTGADPALCDAIFGDRPRTWGISRGVLDGLDRIWVWTYDGTADRVGIPYTPGEWIQVALVHADGVLSAYKNGVFVGSVASGPTAQLTGQLLQLGGVISNASRNWTFQGDLDEVQLWSVARSAAEIAASWNLPLAGTESGLAAYYRMTDGTGTTLTDDSIHDWAGTLFDGASDVPGNGPIAWVPSGAFGAIPPATNTPPVADPQSVSTLEDVPVALTLSGSDADGTAVTFRVTTPPAHGVLAGTAPNLTYTPATNYFGADSFAFVANDGQADSTPAMVSITVTGIDDTPVAQNDAAAALTGAPTTINVLGNDIDVDGDALTIISLGTPQYGSAVISGNAVTFTSPAEFVGTDTFEYTIADPQGGVSSALVTVTVTESADPGYALRFDGVSDFVRLHATANMMPATWTTTKTVSLWVKPTGTASCIYQLAAHCDLIFGDYPQWWGISRGTLGGLDRIWIFNFDGNEDAIGVPYISDEWVHVALVHDGGVLSAYRNGVLVGSVASGPTQQPALTGSLPYLQIGGAIASATRNWTFDGEIDEVQIWSLARTPEEIAQDLAGPLLGSHTGLQAYYRMSDGQGTTLTDDSGNAWTGTVRDGNLNVPPDGPITWVVSGAFVIP